MGKGDKRTKKGKITKGTYGTRRRPKNQDIKDPRKHPTSYAPPEE
ncbi:MAG: 30S ribosomal protein THX [Bacteroidota bacterium]